MSFRGLSVGSLPSLTRSRLRAGLGGLLVALALLGVSQAHAAAERPPGDLVVVTRRDLPPGAVLAPHLLEVIPADLPGPTRDRLFGDPGALEGATTVAPVAAGEPLLLSQVLPAGTRPPEGADVSFAVARERALAGRVRPGETVDVVAGRTGRVSRSVAGDALVLDVDGTDDPLLGAEDRLVLTVRVDDRGEALALVDAVDGGEVTLVRTTGRPGP